MLPPLPLEFLFDFVDEAVRPDGWWWVKLACGHWRKAKEKEKVRKYEGIPPTRFYCSACQSKSRRRRQIPLDTKTAAP